MTARPPLPRGMLDLPVRRERTFAACAFGLFLVLASVRASGHTHPYFDDVGFLDLGNKARELGGPVALFQALYDGTWTEDNRNPLYIAVLSTVAGRDHGYHARAQALTILLGALALFACWRVARRHVGPRAALVLLVFLAASETLIDYSARESAEPLLLVLWAFAVDALLRGAEGDRRWWLLGGALAGLAHLEKGSGIFLVFCFGVALLWARGWRAIKDPWAWGVGGSFLFAASPLLVRNLRLWGTPLHHWNNRLLWIDRLPDYAEIYAPGALDKLPNGFLDWLRQTSLGEILVGRVGLGIGETAVHVGDAMSFVAPSPLGAVHLPGVVLGFGLFALAVWLVWRSERGFARSFMLVQAGFFFLFFAAFAACGGSSRYVFPMTWAMYAVVARGLVSTAEAQGTWWRGWPLAWSGLAAACVLLAVSLDPAPRALSPGFEQAQTWLEDHLFSGEVYAVDSRSHLEPEWFLPASNSMEIVSSTWGRAPVPAQELVAHFRARQVRWVVIDATSHKDGARRYFFWDRMPLLPDGSLPLSGNPAGTRIAWADPRMPREWMILEVLPDDALGPAAISRHDRRPDEHVMASTALPRRGPRLPRLRVTR